MLSFIETWWGICWLVVMVGFNGTLSAWHWPQPGVGHLAVTSPLELWLVNGAWPPWMFSRHLRRCSSSWPWSPPALAYPPAEVLPEPCHPGPWWQLPCRQPRCYSGHGPSAARATATCLLWLHGRWHRQPGVIPSHGLASGTEHEELYVRAARRSTYHVSTSGPVAAPVFGPAFSRLCGQLTHRCQRTVYRILDSLLAEARVSGHLRQPGGRCRGDPACRVCPCQLLPGPTITSANYVDRWTRLRRLC